jgi:hypothetical protein
MNNIKGGKVVDSGGYGCLFIPPLECKGKNTQKKNVISKLTQKRVAEREHKTNLKIHKILSKIPNWKQYFIFSIKSCFPKKLTKKDLKQFNKKCKTLTRKKYTKKTINSRIEELKILQFPYGGKSLENYIYTNTANNIDLFKDVNNKLIKLLKNAIIPMNKNNVYHLDIKDTNILVGDTNRLKLIDWGLSHIITKDLPSHIYNKSVQFNYPFTSILLNTPFLKKLIEFMKKKEKEKNLVLFIKNYFNDEISLLYGDGHFEYLKEVFGQFSNNKNPHDVVFNFCANSILQHTKNGVFDHRSYFEKTFLKNVDIWGFLSIYMSFLLIKTPKMEKIKENIEKLLFKHLFNNYTTIDIQDLYNDLQKL